VEEGLARLKYGLTNFTAIQFYPTILLARAEAMERVGDRKGASLAYSDFIDLWSTADPALQPRVASARAKLEQLAREGP
jgi:hypothetical protein